MAVRVPKAYFDTSAASPTATASLALGFEVQTPPCFTQKVQPHARAGISGGSPSHSSSKAILPQWHLPLMSMRISAQVGRLTLDGGVSPLPRRGREVDGMRFGAMPVQGQGRPHHLV